MKALKLGQAFALVLWISACQMPGICKTNEDCPQEGTFCFLGTPPKLSSSGICSMPSALGQPLDDAQPSLLSLQLSHGTLAFSPMKIGNYSGNFATFNLAVSGFRNKTDAANVELNLDKPSWLSWGIQRSSFSEGTQTFAVELRYEGSTFIELPSTLRLSLGNIPENYEYDNEPQSIHVVVGSGEKNNPIPVVQANIQTFNDYARTDGLERHYRLFEDIALEAPLPPETSNWVAIGKYISGASNPLTEAFTGSFDGNGHTLSGLVIDSAGDDQGLFGVVGQGAIIESLGLIDLSVKGDNGAGGLVGYNYGTVLGSYATGKVEGGNCVGCLVGHNNGTVLGSYATGSVESSRENAGGLVGTNEGGTVQNSYATGSVKGRRENVGGLVGYNSPSGTVQNCVALNSSVMGNTSTNNSAGRVVGYNNGGTMTNNYARNTGMTLSHQPVSGPNLKDGAGRADYDTRSFWESAPLSWDFTSAWQWGSNNLPILQKVGGGQNHTAP
jgi:hypothetical protein